jgi:DNA polymerase-3 subunit gamma/tau
MASTSHANTYRPQSLDDVLGQPRHVKSLKYFLKHNELPPVILISGKSGTGKTTTARIVAAAAMCQQFNPETISSCGTCVNCRSAQDINDGPNFMHLDGAGQNLKDIVENDLKMFLYSSPVKARYKVCVADEAQALSAGAKNSLLTLAENLPKSSLIIMTTTDPEAIDSAILTRALKYHFAPISSDQLVEGVIRHRPALDSQSSREALETLAFFAEGSMREFWQLIQQWESYEEELTPDLAAEIVGGAKKSDRQALWTAVNEGNFAAIPRAWRTMINSGANPQRLGAQLMTDIYVMSAKNPLERDWTDAIRLMSQAQVYKEEQGFISALMAIAKSPAEQVHSLTVEDLAERVAHRIISLIPKPETPQKPSEELNRPIVYPTNLKDLKSVYTFIFEQ